MLDEGARALIVGILRESLEDYFDHLVKLKHEEWQVKNLELFFESDWCYWLSSTVGIDMPRAVKRVVELSGQQTEQH